MIIKLSHCRLKFYDGETKKKYFCIEHTKLLENFNIWNSIWNKSVTVL